MLQNRKGFTLIELLIVVVIIGILAAVAIPRFGQTRERAYISAMQSDLRNLQTSQEMYYADLSRDGEPYTYLHTGQATATNPIAALNNFTASQGVTVTLADGGATEGTGWSATATHSALPDVTCEVYVGDATGDIAPGPGVVACSNETGDDDN